MQDIPWSLSILVNMSSLDLSFVRSIFRKWEKIGKNTVKFNLQFKGKSLHYTQMLIHKGIARVCFID